MKKYEASENGNVWIESLTHLNPQIQDTVLDGKCDSSDVVEHIDGCIRDIISRQVDSPRICFSPDVVLELLYRLRRMITG